MNGSWTSSTTYRQRRVSFVVYCAVCCTRHSWRRAWQTTHSCQVWLWSTRSSWSPCSLCAAVCRSSRQAFTVRMYYTQLVTRHKH